MNKTHALEEERQSILRRMRASRAEYKRVLSEDNYHLPQHDQYAAHLDMHATQAHYRKADTSGHASQSSSSDTDNVIHHHSLHSTPAQIASTALHWIRRHPFLCAAGVAAVVALGPGRIARKAMKGGAALGILTLRNTKNSDAITLLLSTAASYLKRKSPSTSEGQTRKGS